MRLQIHKTNFEFPIRVFPVGAEQQMTKKTRLNMTVNDAARVLKVAPTTVYGMVERKELSSVRDKHGHIHLDAREVAHAPRRGRGRQFAAADDLRGKRFAELHDEGMTVAAIARRFSVSRQAVSKEIARYREAAVRDA